MLRQTLYISYYVVALKLKHALRFHCFEWIHTDEVVVAVCINGCRFIWCNCPQTPNKKSLRIMRSNGNKVMESFEFKCMSAGWMKMHITLKCKFLFCVVWSKPSLLVGKQKTLTIVWKTSQLQVYR